MPDRRWALAAALFLLWAGPTVAMTFVSFDPPGSYDTYPASINKEGKIVGYYNDEHIRGHAFLRAPNGAITLLSVPVSSESRAVDINDQGWISGWYQIGGHISAFLLSPSGTLATYSVAGAPTTYPGAANASGAVAGSWVDRKGDNHGFVREPDGTIKTFDPPVSTYTSASGIDDKGEIFGYILDSSRVGYGYVRSPSGKFTFFDPPKSNDTLTYAMTQRGVAAGSFLSSTANRTEGFVRSISGAIATFALTPPDTEESSTYGVNNGGDTTGYFIDVSGVWQLFVHAAGGGAKGYSPFGASQATGTAINDKGVVVGNYLTKSSHGFIGTP